MEEPVKKESMLPQGISNAQKVARQRLDGRPRWQTYLVQLVVCLAIGLLLGAVIILAVQQNVLEVYAALIREAFFTPLGIMIGIQRATPLLLTAAAAVAAFRGGAINMGLEGQFMVGAAAAAISGGALPEMPRWAAVLIVFVISGIMGAAAGWVPAFFKVVSGVSEVITGMIANLIMPSLLSIFLSLPLIRLVRSAARGGVQPWAQLDQFADLTHGGWGYGTKANTGIFAALIIVALLGFVYQRTRTGYRIRIASANFKFAEFAGINARRQFYAAMMISGAVAGMAGATEILGVWRGYNLNTISVGYNGLLIALAGGNTFGGATLAALIYGGLQSGAMNASWATSIPRPLIDVLVEILVVFAAVPSMRIFFSGSGYSDSERLGGQFTHKD